MHKIASPRDLQHELGALLAYSQSKAPSRVRLATALYELSERVAMEPPSDIDAALAFNVLLAKRLQALKRDAGAESVKANYKGTGRQRFRRQLWVRFVRGMTVDLWLEQDRISFLGVTQRGVRGPNGVVTEIQYAGRSPDEVYKEVAAVLAHWSANTEPPAWAVG